MRERVPSRIDRSIAHRTHSLCAKTRSDITTDHNTLRAVNLINCSEIGRWPLVILYSGGPLPLPLPLSLSLSLSPSLSLSLPLSRRKHLHCDVMVHYKEKLRCLSCLSNVQNHCTIFGTTEKQNKSASSAKHNDVSLSHRIISGLMSLCVGGSKTPTGTISAIYTHAVVSAYISRLAIIFSPNEILSKSMPKVSL